MTGEVRTVPNSPRAWEDAFQQCWAFFEDEYEITAGYPSGIERTLQTWRVRFHVPFDEVIDAMELAFISAADPTEGVGLYFCKVVWNKISTAATLGWSKR